MTIQNKKFETIELITQDKVLEIKINRPKQLNALNLQVLTELKEILESLQGSKEITGAYLIGSGEKAFIAGADIKEMSDMTDSSAHEFSLLGQKVTTLMESLPFPIVAAVNGFALGGGMEMAMSCDFILATKSAVFGQPEVKLGLIPGFGGTQRLSRLVGRSLAREMVYSGRNVLADEALKIGIINQLVENGDELKDTILKFFKKCQKNSPLAIKLAKEVINKGADLELGEGLNVEASVFGKIFLSEDMKEGTKAFTEKRPANFTGK